MALVEVDRSDHIARVRFNRPGRLNALSPDLLRELISTCGTLAADDSIMVIGLEGAGETFSAGADLPAFGDEIGADPIAVADLGRAAADAVAALPQITMASIRGHCIGGGIVLAAACDLRISSDDAFYWIPEVQAGIPLGWGGMERLVRLVGETMVTDLVLTCRPFDASEALRAGFVSRVVPTKTFNEEAAALLASIASRARHPLRTTKRQLWDLRAGSFDPTEDAGALAASFDDPEAALIIAAYTARLR